MEMRLELILEPHLLLDKMKLDTEQYMVAELNV